MCILVMLENVCFALRVRVKLNLLFTCDLFVNILTCCLGLGLGVYTDSVLASVLKATASALSGILQVQALVTWSQHWKIAMMIVQTIAAYAHSHSST